MARHPSYRESYSDFMLSTRPAFYVDNQGNSFKELVRKASVTNTGGVTKTTGPFPSAAASRFSASTADNDNLSVTSNAAYHPGDTFSVGGWFNRIGAGDAAGNILIHLGTNDLVVWITSDTVTLRKATVGNVISSTTTFPSPYTKGWYHVIIAKNAGTSTVLYLNGVSDGGATTNQTIVASTTDPTFGITAPSSGTTNDFDGALAHWAIWSRVLSQAEVRDIYDRGRNDT